MNIEKFVESLSKDEKYELAKILVQEKVMEWESDIELSRKSLEYYDVDCNHCVYSIVNTINNKRYIGQTSKSLIERINQHKYLLREKRHTSSELQLDYEKYLDYKVFQIEILEKEIPQKDLMVKETFWLNQFDRNSLYNSYIPEIN